MSLSQLPELSDEELWLEKWNKTKQFADALWEEAQLLIRKGRILSEDKEDPDFLNWVDLLVTVFEKRLGKNREILRKTAAFHPFISSTVCYSDKLNFDLHPPHSIQGCARMLLSELREANKEENAAPIIL